MKYWKKNLGNYMNVTISLEDLKSNRNLRRFKHVRTFFIIFNPAVSLVLLSLVLTGVI